LDKAANSGALGPYIVLKEGRIPASVVSHYPISGAVVLNLLFSRGIAEEIHVNIWEVFEEPHPCPGRYVQRHSVQHKQVANAVTLLRLHRPQ